MKTNLVKIFTLIIVYILFSSPIRASENLAQKLQAVLKLPSNEAEERLHALTIQFIAHIAIDSVENNRKLLISNLSESNLANKDALIYEIEAYSSKSLLRLGDAKFFVKKAIAEPNLPENLLLRLLKLLAYIETDLENYLAAVENYKIIEELLLRKDNNQQKLAINHMGLADVYLKTGLYKEAVSSLKMAIDIAQKRNLKAAEHTANKKMAIVYFYLRKADSLQFYTKKAFNTASRIANDSVSYHRLNYMKLILEKNPSAISEIRKVINDPKDHDKLMSGFHLAQAYTEFNQLENAKKFILVMLETGDLKNLTFLSSQLYKLLSSIYVKENNYNAALIYYRKNVEQLTLYAEKQYKSDNILTILKYHEIKARYDKIEEEQKVKKNYFLLSLVIATMIIIFLFTLYRTVSIKKKYDKLAYDKLNDELSFINSHDVRKHLSNILGIITVVHSSENKLIAYGEMEQALIDSAENLDSSIRNIASKLDDYSK
ncbi:MAG: hypothetical protein EOO87_04950 [Pedobacter sp.]|nr:MAG: hypothetical protein EOO87_04950 [Pedobacter sp.]